jgi:hypothetical protein
VIRTRYFTWQRRDSDPGPYHTLKVDVGGRHEVEITASPTGRSIHIHVNGKPWALERA